LAAASSNRSRAGRDDARLLPGVPAAGDFRDGVPEILGLAKIRDAVSDF
jgi:hypothetical protein